MRSIYRLLMVYFIIPFVAHAQYGQLASVNISDPAPALRVGEWIKGTPVRQFEKGKIYVIEFWATWCRPCLLGMPHLSVVAEKFKDRITIIAIDIYEGQVRPLKSNQKIKAFVDSMGNRMDFNVAIEDSNFTVTDWIKGTGEEHDGIPRTFIVNKDGRLAWIGNPYEIDEVLPKIINNTWDPKQELARRNSNIQLAMLDDSLQYELIRFTRNSFNANNKDNPDSALLAIGEIVRKEPNLKYAPKTAWYTFSALLQTDQHEAYDYGKIAIVTPSYEGEPPYDNIIYLIERYSGKLKLDTEIYELGAEAYLQKIDQVIYPELVHMSRLYKGMAEMYWRAKNKIKAIEAQQKAIEALKIEKDFSKKDLSAFELKLQQYKNM